MLAFTEIQTCSTSYNATKVGYDTDARINMEIKYMIQPKYAKTNLSKIF
jgi:hypothetical protein